MKIALVNSEYPTTTGMDHGGIATYTFTLANMLVENGHIVHLFSREGVFTDEASDKVTLHTITYRKQSNIFKRLLSRLFLDDNDWQRGLAFDLFQKVNFLARKKDIDIVEYPEYGGLGFYFKSKGGIPTVVTLHTPTELVDTLNEIAPTAVSSKMYHMEKVSIVNASACKSPSKALKEYTTNYYHIDPSRISVLKNPFSAEYARVKYVAKSDPAAGPFNVLFSGRLEYRKGAEILLRSIKRILAIHPDISFTIAGETDIKHHQNYRAAIERILSPEERQRVWFLGAVNRKNLFALYKNSSCFLFPSLFENAPYALLEAMANGLPVIASDKGGIPEFIEHGTNGLLFSPLDKDEPAQSIAKLFHNRELAAALGLAAEIAIDKQFDVKKHASEYIDFYQSVIDKHR